MRCKETERILGLAPASLGDAREAAPLRAHAARCAECDGALRALEALAGATSIFDVPEPDPAYWPELRASLEARLSRRPAWWRVPLGFPSPAARLALAVGSAALAVLGLVAVRPGAVTGPGGPARDTATADPRAEEDLIARLQGSQGEALDDALDAIAPATLPESIGGASAYLAIDVPEELVYEAGDPGAGLPWLVPSDGVYELFHELDEESRTLVLEALREDLG